MVCKYGKNYEDDIQIMKTVIKHLVLLSKKDMAPPNSYLPFPLSLYSLYSFTLPITFSDIL